MWPDNIIKNTILVYFSIINTVTRAKNVGEKCTPNDKISDGICTRLSECSEAVKDLGVSKYQRFQRCGFIGFEQIVCCPTENMFDVTTKPSNVKRIAEEACEKMESSTKVPIVPFVLGGTAVKLGNFPYVVALGYNNGYDEYSFKCGGSLLSDSYVLTAAHCITLGRTNVPPSLVRVGIVELKSETWTDDTDYGIAELIPHPNYTPSLKYNDLALLKLNKTVKFSSNIKAVCLDTSTEEPISNFTVAGWGLVNFTDTNNSNDLLMATVEYVSNEKCNESYQNWFQLPEGIINTQMCARNPKGNIDACQGDSGGPLVISRNGIPVREYLVGVISFAQGCGSFAPGVYTRLSQYLDWIESVVWPNNV